MEPEEIKQINSVLAKSKTIIQNLENDSKVIEFKKIAKDEVDKILLVRTGSWEFIMNNIGYNSDIEVIRGNLGIVLKFNVPTSVYKYYLLSENKGMIETYLENSFGRPASTFLSTPLKKILDVLKL